VGERSIGEFMDKFLTGVVGLMVGFGIIVVFGLVISLPVYWLWNAILPELFGFKEISWLQAWGLLILCGLLFRNSVSSD
jgi:magnesium-transporting ATPase (P-type)